ncbi:SRPBCC family protein [Williamsia phyllosphaerae]|uniref:Potassium-transporting ATPase subunit F n=1 Tax=Williamsia phyllosphaerae TaxID=885042 RepID=A0ABQ1UF06_9NOCA|nr:SRPBCC family protein [Williamsia phyllosphaerae]GGF17092.1 potassium-transporting ATPase subunit F [Williamsia phyllosphaerae]
MAPTPYTVSRSTEITAPADAVFGLVADFHEWTAWSPWERNDPDVERTYSGPDSGQGASYEWRGNRKAGAGGMTITEADRPGRVAIDLRFDKPFSSESTVVFTIVETESSTTVDWTMAGHSTGFAKLFAKVVPMDKLIGKDFERGLRNLKEQAESGR